jgi:plastocyanin
VRSLPFLAMSLAAAVLAPAVPVIAGTVTGSVTLVDKGGRPAKDLADVVVYVENARPPRPRSSPTPAPPTPTIVMKGKAFTPRVAVVASGGTVEFPNEDPIFHNVFSVSGENRFDLELYKRPKTGKATFQHPGVVKVYCNIHPQMSAVVVVRDNPYFTKAGPDGRFTLEGVPAGKYVLKAWHERGGEVAVDVTVPAEGGVQAAPLALDASKFKTVAHKNKFGKDYSTDDKY